MIKPHQVNRIIRDAFQRALELEGPDFRLSGRGHEPRVSFDSRLAAIVRSLELPRVYISGYGANFHYPRRLVERTIQLLSNQLSECPIELSRFEHVAYRLTFADEE